MIVRIKGKLIEKNELSIVIDVHGLYYEVIVPLSVMQRLDQNVELITYHYMQMDPARGLPVLVGFTNAIEKDFFQEFIKVSGIGPRAAVKALNRPISEISRAIDEGNSSYLKGLPGIGPQRAKEIVAKLQGKIARFALIQDKMTVTSKPEKTPGWQEEALAVLLQLQYKRPEALAMIQKSLERSGEINSAEELLNDIYKQRVKG